MTWWKKRWFFIDNVLWHRRLNVGVTITFSHDHRTLECYIYFLKNKFLKIKTWHRLVMLLLLIRCFNVEYKTWFGQTVNQNVLMKSHTMVSLDGYIYHNVFVKLIFLKKWFLYPILHVISTSDFLCTNVQWNTLNCSDEITLSKTEKQFSMVSLHWAGKTNSLFVLNSLSYTCL